MSALLMPPHQSPSGRVDRLYLDELQPAVARRDQQRASRKALRPRMRRYMVNKPQYLSVLEDGDCGYVVCSGH
ncbi:hypothetical protein HB777_39530 (plasmid) [Mesorhizobium loti]|nr:hypothetical protein HB777_39530 [Mesorhizobium loti]